MIWAWCVVSGVVAAVVALWFGWVFLRFFLADWKIERCEARQRRESLRQENERNLRA